MHKLARELKDTLADAAAFLSPAGERMYFPYGGILGQGADANGTTFYVDDLKAASSVPAAAAVGQQGQLGSFHGGATGGSKVGGDGYYLDDWRVYDAALTTNEVRALKSALLPDPFIIRVR